MKYSKYLAIAVLVCFGALALQQVAKADLTVQETVDRFNGTKFIFDTTAYVKPYSNPSRNVGEYKLSVTKNEASLLNAYVSKTSGNYYFSTFCIEANQTIEKGTYSGILSYDSNSGKTVNTSGVALSLGAAFLYQQFATGQLTGYEYGTNTSKQISDHKSDAVMLQDAIHFLTGQKTAESTTWSKNSSNDFLKYLYSLNDSKTYWTKAYNLNETYADARLGNLSDYAVFVLNIGTNQDQLLVAKVDRPSSDVPEPAMMLLWLTGGLSALGYAKKRRKTTSLA